MTHPPSFEVERLREACGPDMDAVLALYERAIPACERKTEQTVRSMAASPDHVVLAARKDGAVIGFALLFRGRQVALLEYMAVHEEQRGSGVGEALYRKARRAAGALPLLVEVESDREAAADQALRRRRLAFYRRLGCRRLPPLDYVLPLPSAEPHPLIDLLVDGAAGSKLDAEVVRSWLKAIYAGVYGCRPDHPALTAALRSVPPESALS